MKIFRLCPCK